jgi:hypothetical protein
MASHFMPAATPRIANLLRLHHLFTIAEGSRQIIFTASVSDLPNIPTLFCALSDFILILSIS